ncbi:MAG TPA: hypothetical protein VMV40_04415 [Acidiferrobacter sp.]|nr:hypothetical protein [Acidiferrobacter sp.]
MRLKRILWIVGGLTWAGACVAHVGLVPGEWRIDAHTSAGDLHRSACLTGHRSVVQILRRNNSQCHVVGPIIIHGTQIAVTEDCNMGSPGGRPAMNIRIVAHLQIQADGRGFTGTTHTIMATPFGNITEHEQISGVRTGACTSR